MGEVEEWLQYKPLWKKWSYKMAEIDYDKNDWEQQSYLIFRQALATYNVNYGITFSAYYRMALYRYGNKYRLRKGGIQLLGENQEREEEDVNVNIEAMCMNEAITKSQRYMIGQALQTLTQEERELIEAFYLAGVSLGVIAKQQGRTYSAVEIQKRRILKKMKKVMENASD